MLDSSASNDPVMGGWTTLDELRTFVNRSGWLSDDFELAVQAVGTNPVAVAAYLQLKEMRRALGELKEQKAKGKYPALS